MNNNDRIISPSQDVWLRIPQNVLMKKKIFLFILVLILGKSNAQETAFISNKNKIANQLLFQKIYTCSAGVPTQWVNGSEVQGYLTKERHLFFRDSVFEEFVFFDDLEGIPKSSYMTLTESTIDALIPTDTLNRITEISKIILYRGYWSVKSDKVYLDYELKSYFLDNGVFRDCFFQYHSGLSPDHLFNCDNSVLLYNPAFKQKKEFVFQNNELIEIGERDLKYK